MSSFARLADNVVTPVIGALGTASVAMFQTGLSTAIGLCTLGFMATKWYRLLRRTQRESLSQQSTSNPPSSK